MAYHDLEDSRMYQRAEKLTDATWDSVIVWNQFSKDTVGKQLVRACDSIGANIAESSGRYHVKDVIRFLHIARGSMRETRYWLKRAVHRRLISPELFNQQMSELSLLGREINGYIKYQRSRTVSEDAYEYEISYTEAIPLTNHPPNQPTHQLTNPPSHQPTHQPTHPPTHQPIIPPTHHPLISPPFSPLARKQTTPIYPIL